jgi:hypothetical protein
MKWSKLKATAESFLAESLRGRLKYHITNYGSRDSSSMARAWITLDGAEIANFSTVGTMIQQGEMAWQIREINQTQDYRDPAQAAGYYSAREQALEIVAKKGVFSRDQFCDALVEYINSSIEDALQSKNPTVQAVAMFDRRCGIRRLETMKISEQANALAKTCYKIRCESEQLQSDSIEEE